MIGSLRYTCIANAYFSLYFSHSLSSSLKDHSPSSLTGVTHHPSSLMDSTNTLSSLTDSTHSPSTLRDSTHTRSSLTGLTHLTISLMDSTHSPSSLTCSIHSRPNCCKMGSHASVDHDATVQNLALTELQDTLASNSAI